MLNNMKMNEIRTGISILIATVMMVIVAVTMYIAAG